MSHWAEPLIGLPWAPAPAAGPDGWYCWALVQQALRRGYAVEMPDLPIGDEEVGVTAIKQAASGWRQVIDDPRDMDILLLAGSDGRHVGLVVAVGPTLRLLHADGRPDAAGRPTGEVEAPPLEQVLASRRYSRFELWRKE